MAYGGNSSFCHHVLNDMDVINRHFRKHQQMKKNLSKCFHWRYGALNLESLCFLPFPRYLGFKLFHLPNAYLKSTFETVWELELDALDAALHHRFRSKDCINQYVFQFWQLVSGTFVPRGRMGRHYTVTDQNVDAVCAELLSGKHKMMCLNDSKAVVDFELCKEKINAAFETLLPVKSVFEL